MKILSRLSVGERRACLLANSSLPRLDPLDSMEELVAALRIEHWGDRTIAEIAKAVISPYKVCACVVGKHARSPWHQGVWSEN